MQKVSKNSLFLGFIIPPMIITVLYCIAFTFISILDYLSGGRLATEYLLRLTPVEAIFFIIGSLIAVCFFTFLFSGIQSLIYTFVMHYKVFPRISSSFKRILISGLLGGIAACLPLLLLLILSLGTLEEMLDLDSLSVLLNFFSFGFVVGLLSGWMLQYFYNVSQAKTVALKDETD